MDYRKSADDIQNEMLSNISDSYEKSKGYFLWDILKAISIRIKELLESLQDVANSLDVENLSGEKLERFIYQRTCIKRREASYAKGVITVNGNGSVNEGDFFETEGFVRFKATESAEVINTADIQIQAINPGISGNVPAQTITKMPITITGISSCVNNAVTSEGYEAETDADLLIRYYERLQMPATSGNVYHYKQWAKEVQGVGDAKVFPLWNGDNTVKVVIIDQNRLPASKELVDSVQEYIDPEITGKGEGEAPIGAFCTVVSAEGKEINISLKITLASGYEQETVKLSIKNSVSQYLKSIAFASDYLSYAVVGATILDVDGVIDYSDLTINGDIKNIECGAEEVMVIGSVELIE